MPGLNELREKIKADADFAGKVRECRDYDALVEFARTQGFSFSRKEIEALTDVVPADIRAASGGIGYAGKSANIRVLASGSTIDD